MWRTAQRLHELGWPERRLLAEALVRMVLARILVFHCPFTVLSRRLGPRVPERTVAVTAAQAAQAERIGWAVRAMARRLGPLATCLIQAVAAKAMLDRRAVPTRLCLGMRRREDRQDLHAWLDCGGAAVTGGGDLAGYALVGIFGAGTGNPGERTRVPL